MKRLEGYVQQVQEQSRWCWAAVACSIAEYRGRHDWVQCTLAREILDRVGCCADPSVCNVTASLQTALARANSLAEARSGPVELETLQGQISSDLPVGIRLEREDGTAHVMAIVGFDDGIGADCVLTILDPWSGLDHASYGALTAGLYSHGEWSHTYFTT
jgi:papain like cysteine protease AvrRpt2